MKLKRILGKWVYLSYFLMSFVMIFPSRAAGNGVEHHGWLSVHAGRLIDRNFEVVRLRGMSSHGLTWRPLFINSRSLVSLRERGANVFRAAMYVSEYRKSEDMKRYSEAMMYLAIENALAAGMYVIADWHVLDEKNPLYTLGEAVPFFQKLAARYAEEPGVLYEICNEPNGETTWQDIKKYSEIVIPAIRAHSPQSVVIVGTPNWSLDVLSVFQDPLPFKNIMYAYHFYTGLVSEETFFTALDTAEKLNLPVFVSEWGISRGADGNLDVKGAYDFIDYSRKKKLSWVNWSLSDTAEDYSAIRPDRGKLSGWEDDDLTPSGRVVFNSFEDHYFKQVPIGVSGKEPVK
jgi:aryl-phospho-beta-D-glucosidase BglC (GH1 family)